MTTVQTMRNDGQARARAVRGRVFAAALIAWAVASLPFGGCVKDDDRLSAPEVLVAPYLGGEGEVLWAVAPLRNESGVSAADSLLMTDALATKIEQTRGLACVPVNRTLAAMRARGIHAVRSPQDARALATLLGADAVVVGSVTAWDPYDPPKVGLTLGLFGREPRPGDGPGAGDDPMRLQAAYTDLAPGVRAGYLAQPLSTTSDVLDGANHEVQVALRRYAHGRHEAGTALGWKRMLKSMDLYAEFAAEWSVARLLEQERLRIGRGLHRPLITER